MNLVPVAREQEEQRSLSPRRVLEVGDGGVAGTAPRLCRQAG